MEVGGGQRPGIVNQTVSMTGVYVKIRGQNIERAIEDVGVKRIQNNENDEETKKTSQKKPRDRQGRENDRGALGDQKSKKKKKRSRLELESGGGCKKE